MEDLLVVDVYRNSFVEMIDGSMYEEDMFDFYSNENKHEIIHDEIFD